MLVFLLRIFFVLTLIIVPATAESYRYEPVISTLSGEIQTEPQFGPPGFGEDPKTDERINIYVLLLDHPISVIGDPESYFNTLSDDGLTKLQLSISPDEIQLRPNIGEHCTLTGTLYGAHSVHHYTPVLLSVNSVDCEKD